MYGITFIMHRTSSKAPIEICEDSKTPFKVSQIIVEHILECSQPSGKSDRPVEEMLQQITVFPLNMLISKQSL